MLPERAITVQWSSPEFVGGLLEGKGCKEPCGAANRPRVGNGTFGSFSQSCAHTSSSFCGGWRSTAACSSSVSSLLDWLSSPTNADNVASRSRESTCVTQRHKTLKQDTHVWHNRVHASKATETFKRYDKDHAGAFIGCPLAGALTKKSCRCVEVPWRGFGHSQPAHNRQCSTNASDCFHTLDW